MAERGHVFTDNNYYLCTDIDKDGNFKVVATLPIESNEDLINEIRKEGRKENFVAIPITESTNRIVSEVRCRGGRISWNDAVTKRFDSDAGGNASVSVGQQANTRTNRRTISKDGGAKQKKRIAEHINSLYKS